jgi:amino acid adenylation domain-containing protein
MQGRSAAGPANVATMLRAASTRVPDKQAVVERERAVTYADLAARAGAVSHVLRAAGVGRGDRVAVLLDRGADAVAAYFGALAAGGVVVMLNSALRPRQIEYALSHSGARVLLTSSALLVRMHRDITTDAALLDLDDLPTGGPFEPIELDEHDPAQITYTSGSTGMPKGVVASHANVGAAIRIVADYLGLEESDRIAGLLPPSGVYGANQVLCAVLVGATLVVPTSPLMNQVAAELRDAEATVLAAVPPLWLQLIQAPGFTAEPFASLRILQNAGGHLAPAVVRQLRALQPQARIFLQYGMTEVFRSSYLPPEEIDRLPGSMGRPMAETEILVVREDGTVCEVDEVGELVHCGPTVTQGYWNEPERTDQVYRPHPVTGEGRVVYSGDMVRRDADGFLHFVGRRDRMIKTLGYRVGPDEILDVLLASGEIEEGVVTALEDADRGQGVVAYVVLKEGSSLKALRQFCRAELPRYMQPTRFVELDELPKLPNGKHDLSALGALAVGT